MPEWLKITLAVVVVLLLLGGVAYAIKSFFFSDKSTGKRITDKKHTEKSGTLADRAIDDDTLLEKKEDAEVKDTEAAKLPEVEGIESDAKTTTG